MTQRRKNLLLLLLMAASLSFILLSSSLSTLQLQDGVPFPAVDPRYAAQGGGARQGDVLSFSFLQVFLGLLLFLLMVYVPARLILFLRVKWLFRVIQILAILLVVVVLFSFINFETDCSAADCPDTGIAPATAAPVSSVYSPPPEIIYVAGIGLAVAVALLLLWIFTRIYRTPGQDPVLKHAEHAVQAIRSGMDLRNVIIQCYLRMETDLKDEHGIERSASMTSREFEALLISRGFPAGPVHGLTQLFEKVRYSREDLTKSDETKAMDSLREIVDFSEGNQHG